MSDYAPFPEAELREFAAKCDKAIGFLRPGPLRMKLELRGRVCRNAIASHDALRERCLLAEMNLRSAEALLKAHGIAFVPASVDASEAAD